MAIRKYVWIEKGIYRDGFRDYPLTSTDVGNVATVDYRGWCYITENTMRINPSGDPFGAVYDFEIGPCTPESLQIANEYESGYELGKMQKRARWPADDKGYTFKQGWRTAWEERGKVFDNAYWKQYWRNRSRPMRCDW